MEYVGIDIGSTAAKICCVHNGSPVFLLLPTGWSTKDTADFAAKELLSRGIDVYDKSKTITASTGYGRGAVEYADFSVTEITCHGRGAAYLSGGDCTVIDVGGQDTKIITVKDGQVIDFLMNDKCAAGTGKFIELMANRLAFDIPTLFSQAKEGTAIPISSLCTVFAESEVISLIGQNRERKDIAAGVVDSVAVKVSALAAKRQISDTLVLTGGLSQSPYFGEVLSEKLKKPVRVPEKALYAGAIGAMLSAEKKAR